MKPEKSAKSKGKRRQFSPEFKFEAVQLAQSPGQSIAIVAKDLGVSEGNLRSWIKQAAVDAGNGPSGALTTAEKQELAALRREVKDLRMEREILRKATSSLRSSRCKIRLHRCGEDQIPDPKALQSI